MKNLYSLVLMATALLIGTNVWATTQADIQDVFNNGGNITLTSDVVVTSPLQMYAKKAETGKTVNLNLGGFTISNHADLGQKALIELYKGTLNITNGQIATTANCEAIKVFGAYEDVANWSILNVGAGVTVSSTYSGTATLKANAISILEFKASSCTYIKKEYAGQELSDEYGFNSVDPNDYKVTYYVYKDTEGQARKSATVSAGNALVDNGTIDYSSTFYKAGTTVYSLKDSKGRGPYEYVKLSSEAAAFGANVNILEGALVHGDKYGIKINGTIKADGINVPKVHIANGAEVKADANAPEATAVYSSGNGVFVIEGNVHGSTGVYVKGGSVTVEEGATIKSDNTAGAGISTTGKSSGIDAGGNAIAIEGNNAAYTSEGISVQINGGEIIAGKEGYAVQNLNNEAAQSNPNAVTISGGEFEGGAAGCVTIDNTKGNVDVELEGGTFTGNIETLIAATGDEDKIIQEVVAQEGGQATVVIGQKEAGDVVEQPATPQEKQDFVFVNNMSNDIVKLDATTANIAKTLPAGETVVKYLSLTGTGAYTSTVTVEAGKTLKVGQIVMNANGRLIVEAGATLVVTGSNGIFADNVENLVLETEEGNHSSFLLHPSVANNQHPKATVQFVSKSYNVSATDYRNQRFGIPTIGAVESITAEYQGSPVQTRIWGYFNGSWDVIGDLNTGSTFDVSKLNQPFAYYQMNNKAADKGSVITMTGNLVGIADPELEVTANNWSTFTNSFMADMNAEQMMSMFDGHDNIDATLQTYTPTSANTFAWFPFNYSDVIVGSVVRIEPMQAFIIKNNGAADKLQMSYKNMVWNPMFPSEAVMAPRRVVAASDLTTARVEVRNAAGVYDYVTLLAGDQFTAEYNNGYDAEKIMNNTLDLYTVGTKNQATLATDDLNNTILGLNCVEAGTYTISFSHINGEELTLIDHATGAQVAMVEGATYEFTAEANSTNDYRFEIVSAAKMPTAIENAEAVKSAKGIYTITGQYVGEMNVWNTLPAGIYVVNGEKLVK